MKVKRQKNVRKILTFYRNSFGYRSPFQVLVDGTFCRAALNCKVNISEQLPKYLDAEIRLCTTRCVLAECEALGQYSVVNIRYWSCDMYLGLQIYLVSHFLSIFAHLKNNNNTMWRADLYLLHTLQLWWFDLSNQSQVWSEEPLHNKLVLDVFVDSEPVHGRCWAVAFTTF